MFVVLCKFSNQKAFKKDTAHQKMNYIPVTKWTILHVKWASLKTTEILNCQINPNMTHNYESCNTCIIYMYSDASSICVFIVLLSMLLHGFFSVQIQIIEWILNDKYQVKFTMQITFYLFFHNSLAFMPSKKTSKVICDKKNI